MEGPLRGGILASECGLGKTNSYLAAIYADVRNQLAQGDDNPEMTYEPSIIVAPAHLVHQVFAECSVNFKSLLEPWVFYGTPASTKNPAQRSRVLTTPKFTAKMTALHTQRHKPEVCLLPALLTRFRDRPISSIAS